MKNIEVCVLNPQAVTEAEKMMVCAARLTQRGHNIKNMRDFLDLYEKPYTESTVENMCELPHPTIQKFEKINVVITGASRRFLAQITRHQNEVKFMSASLQYSDYSENGEEDNFTIPYELLDESKVLEREKYLTSCKRSMENYKDLVDSGVDNDTAGYEAPQGLRNVLIISATPYQWKHMISQRTCRRNTNETRYVMLAIWNELYKLAPSMFANAGPFCMNGPCKEGKMGCKYPMNKEFTPIDFLMQDYPLLYKNREELERN